ncbi:MAG: sigma-70 family RNA polymerase sigma factor [Anaerolineales bacterium]|nr:sigma-70 family RNA polymerase sigma factor [Anaerolineales bacterium]
MITETELLQQAKRFKEEALTEVYDRYSPGIYRYAMRLLANENLAEECVSETFSRFLKTIKHGNGPDRYLQAYLYRIAHNWITDFFRKHPDPVSIEDLNIAIHSDDPQEEAMKRLEAQNMLSYLKLLTAEQRQVIVLKYLEGWNNEQIAHAMEKPLGAIKALQHRGLQSLRRLLAGDELL